jgi:hypothetical protein
VMIWRHLGLELLAKEINTMTSKGFVVTIVPRWADVDLNQHKRHSAFADWAAYARTEWLNTNGLTMRKLVEPEMTPIMFEDRTRYLKEILLGERIQIDCNSPRGIVTDRGGSCDTPSAEAQRLRGLRSQRGMVQYRDTPNYCRAAWIAGSLRQSSAHRRLRRDEFRRECRRGIVL